MEVRKLFIVSLRHLPWRHNTQQLTSVCGHSAFMTEFRSGAAAAGAAASTLVLFFVPHHLGDHRHNNCGNDSSNYERCPVGRKPIHHINSLLSADVYQCVYFAAIVLS
jgi:hypothetical protein